MVLVVWYCVCEYVCVLWCCVHESESSCLVLVVFVSCLCCGSCRFPVFTMCSVLVHVSVVCVLCVL